MPAGILIRPENQTGRVRSKGDGVALIEPATPRTSEPRIVAMGNVQTDVLGTPGPHNGTGAGVWQYPTAAGDQLLVKCRAREENSSSKLLCP